jgi:hypothetical protein
VDVLEAKVRVRKPSRKEATMIAQMAPLKAEVVPIYLVV